jgi:hypothetical protein
VTIAILVGVLAVFDFVLAGFRAAAGRDGRIDKMPMFRAAMVRGGLWGGVIVAFHGALAMILVATGDSTVWPAFLAAGRDAVVVFGIFATLTALALVFWFSPLHELRIVPTLVILGPLTLLRPLVIVIGLAYASSRSPEPRVWVTAALAGASMLAGEKALGRRYRDRWKRLVSV